MNKLLRLASVLAVLVMAIGCAAPAAAPAAPAAPAATPVVVEKVVRETVTVKETVQVEKAVEKVVTATPAASAGKPVKIALIVNLADHPYIQAIIKNMTDECTRINCTAKLFDARMDANVQASMIEEAISAKYDAIAYLAVDASAAGPALEKAHKAGVKIISMASPVAPQLDKFVDGFVGADMWDQGRAAAVLACDGLGADKEANLVVVEGMAGTTGAQGRSEGFVEKLPKVCPKAKILDKQPADWNRAKALQVTENFLTRYPKIDLIYAHDDDMAQGVLQAVADAGRTNIKVVGIGAMCEGIKAIKDGKMYGTVDQRASLISAYTARALVDLVHGLPVNRTIPIPAPSFTKDTVGDFKCEW